MTVLSVISKYQVSLVLVYVSYQLLQVVRFKIITQCSYGLHSVLWQILLGWSTVMSFPSHLKLQKYKHHKNIHSYTVYIQQIQPIILR